jgi:hypothetical protein
MAALSNLWMKAKITIICSRNGFHPLLGDTDISEEPSKCRICSSHRGGYEEYYPLQCNAMQSIESQLIFQRNILLSSSRAKNKLCLLPAFTPVSHSAYSLTLKMEAICSSKTSVDSQQTTWPYIPKDSTHHTHKNALKCP